MDETYYNPPTVFANKEETIAHLLTQRDGYGLRIWRTADDKFIDACILYELARELHLVELQSHKSFWVGDQFIVHHAWKGTGAK